MKKANGEGYEEIREVKTTKFILAHACIPHSIHSKRNLALSRRYFQNCTQYWKSKKFEWSQSSFGISKVHDAVFEERGGGSLPYPHNTEKKFQVTYFGPRYRKHLSTSLNDGLRSSNSDQHLTINCINSSGTSVFSSGNSGRNGGIDRALTFAIISA